MKYKVIFTSLFTKEIKKVQKRRKDIAKLESKHRNHNLENSTRFKNCRECHIEPDWLLVYRI